MSDPMRLIKQQNFADAQTPINERLRDAIMRAKHASASVDRPLIARGEAALRGDDILEQIESFNAIVAKIVPRSV